MRDRQKLSEKQRNILRFIETYIDTHGFPPTIRQIGEATGIASTSVVNYNLNKLVTAGYLARSERSSRGLRLVKNGKKGTVQPVFSAGASLRINLFGALILEPYYAIPLQKNAKGSFGLNLIPGW